MTRIFWRAALRLGLTSAIAPAAIAFCSSRTLAQVVPDNTVGSVVTNTGNGVDTITGGTTREANLFHSFDSFSVQTGRTAQFENGASIQNIITRVTGNSISDIDGAIAARGTANLFLLNPNGIVFGPNASLNIGGSFIGSTAKSINFADGVQFSATPGESAPLLTVSVPLGLQFGTNPGNIVNRANVTGLQVQPGKTLGLIGGNVSLDGGTLIAAGGRIELGAVAAPGIVGVNTDNNFLRFSFPTDVALADVSITNNGGAITIASNGGSIAVNARNLNILNGGLNAGIIQGSVDSQAGDIEINASDTVTIGSTGSSAFSGILNATLDFGNAGNISIRTGSLNLTGSNALIESFTNGQGNAGNVEIQARDRVTITGTNNITGVASGVGPLGVGNGADISIQTGSLFLSNGAQISASTLGQGNAGSIRVNATDDISISGGSVLQALSIGAGNAGDVDITAGGRLSFDGVGSINLPTGFFIDSPGVVSGTTFSGIVSGLSQAQPELRETLIGRIPEPQSNRIGGNINIQARSLSLTNGAALRASVNSGPGNAGDIQINTTESIFVSSGSLLESASNGQGSAGNVNIKAGDRISFVGAGTENPLTGIFTTLLPVPSSQSDRRGGDINIDARSLSLTNGAQLASSTYGQGNAGNIQVNVADDLFVNSGSFFQAFSASTGNAGDVTITAGNRVSFDGIGNSGIPSSVLSVLAPTSEFQGDRRGGNIRIDARSLSLANRAQLNTSNFGQGSAGNIDVNVRSLDLDDGGIFAGTFSGDGGNIQLRTSNELLLRNNSRISTTAGLSQLAGNGGNISIDSPLVIANFDGNNDITANAFSGSGGRVDLTADSIFGLTPRSREELQTLLGTDDPAQLDPSRLLSNDITAISQTNPSLSGTVTFNATDVNPSRDLVELPTTPVDASTRVATGCPSGAENRFVVTGGGGLPPVPTDKLSPDALLTDWASLPTSETNKAAVEQSIPVATNTTTTPLVEATTWQFGSQGEIILTNANQSSMSNRFDAAPSSCSSSSS